VGATFSRVKNWIAEVLNYADLNAEIDNILTYFTPAGMDDMSATAAAMRLSTDPGEVGTESLPTSLEQEIKRIRYVLQEIKGGDVDYWYESSSVSLTSLRTAIGGALQTNRISSGAASSLSSAARFIVPNGAAASLLINGTPTALSYVVNDTSYSISTDAVTSSLGLAPSSNNTCLVNDTLLAAQESSAYQGEDGTTITVDAMGSEITALVGKLASFKVVHSATTEYFIGLVKSSTEITNCFRGFFYDSTLAQIPRTVISDNDTITLMRTAWIFANTSQVVVLTYNNPTWAATAPSAPNTGDYWYDTSVDYWKTFDSVTWQTANAILIGLTIQDTANCVGARSCEFFTLPVSTNNMELEYVSATVVRNRALLGMVGVGSNTVRFNYSRPTWDITADLETGYTEAASTTYYAYVTEDGDTVLSPLKPYDLSGSLGGFYHPYEIWRYVGKIQNNSGSNFDQYTVISPALYETRSSVRLLENLSLVASVSGSALTIKVRTKDGREPSPLNPVVVSFHDDTVTSGNYVVRKITAPLSITVPSTATLGHTSGMAEYIWVHLLDDAGAVDIAVMGTDAIPDGSMSTATAVSTAADSGTVLYSTSAHSGAKGCRIVGRISSTQATAGTWSTTPSEVSVGVLPQLTTTEWASYTPTWVGLGTVAASAGRWKRIGDSVSIETFVTAGTTTATTASMTLPNSILSNPGGQRVAGVAFRAGTAAGRYAVLIQSASNTVNFGSGGGATEAAATNGNSLLATGDSMYVSTTLISITGWSKYGPT